MSSPGEAVQGRPSLAAVRRLEAVGFRAWPAASSQYDGSWLIRLTAGHPSKRINSLNPLDPSDFGDMEARLHRAARRFSDYGRQLIIRQTPLTPLPMIARLDEEGWDSFGESLVMELDLDAMPRIEGLDHLPVRDVGRFVDARIAIGGDRNDSKPGLTEIITSIVPDKGLFLFEDEASGPTGVCLVVQDNDLAGLLQFAVAEKARRKGIGRAMLAASLRWARLRGARKSWLQVEADNLPALALYRSFGFTEVCRYVYRRRKD